ncbi:beta-propeller fold lactonase family protein, partial [Acinetobacter baumannii]
VSNEKGNSVTILDTDSMTAVGKIKTGQRPRGIEVSPDGKHVFVAASDDDVIQIIDTATRKIVGRLPSGEDPEQFSIDP